MKTRARPRPVFGDFVEEDPLVIALESFRPRAVSALIPKGSYKRLNNPVVKANPTLFAVVLRVDDLDRKIER